jgi:hypothetical protein
VVQQPFLKCRQVRKSLQQFKVQQAAGQQLAGALILQAALRVVAEE